MKISQFLLALTTAILLPIAVSAADVRGVIAQVDLARHELVLDNVKPKRAEHTFLLDDKTQVFYGKEPGTLKDLPLGRHVRADIEERDGKLVVAALHVTGRPPATKAAAESATVAGVLRRVALTDREIVVIGPGAKGPETETTITVPSTVRVLHDDKAITFSDLKEGDKVAVTVDKKDGRFSALTIQTGTGTAAAPVAKDSKVVPRLRLFLRIADAVLHQMEMGKEP